MSSFTSDQTTINMTTVAANTLARTGRCRVTSIQAEGIAGATIILYDSADASAPGSAVATYNYNTEGMQLFIPGSGILFKDGIVYNLAGAGGSVTVTITGA
jgi:hypothetical protein|tara:strand:+ start:69 stop:371 length:303 start_codon:yes stop_codon:yes gene_type:complete